jgi:hypothetical protein
MFGMFSVPQMMTIAQALPLVTQDATDVPVV